jgi:hypothetical protein
LLSLFQFKKGFCCVEQQYLFGLTTSFRDFLCGWVQKKYLHFYIFQTFTLSLFFLALLFTTVPAYDELPSVIFYFVHSLQVNNFCLPVNELAHGNWLYAVLCTVIIYIFYLSNYLQYNNILRENCVLYSSSHNNLLLLCSF